MNKNNFKHFSISQNIYVRNQVNLYADKVMLLIAYCQKNTVHYENYFITLYPAINYGLGENVKVFKIFILTVISKFSVQKSLKHTLY